MNIAVIGSGNIGGTLTRKWAAAGHQVCLGARDPSKSEVQQLVRESGCRVANVSDALAGAEAALFAIPGAAMASTVAPLGNALDGKVVFDATNNIGASPLNSVSTISAAAAGAHVYRAFNIYGWENFAEPEVGGSQVDLFFAGPDGAPRRIAEQLISDVGLRPVWLGGPDHAELVDQFMRVWFALVFEQKKGRRLAFKLLGA